MAELSLTLTRLIEKFKDHLREPSSPLGHDTAILSREVILQAVRFLKQTPELDYNFLMDLTAVDQGLEQTERFTMVYHFYSLKHNSRIRLKVFLPAVDPTVDSLVPLYGIANWYEREVWDMFGIKFNGHPNLKRLLLYEQFVGHPLRKDYPLNKQQPLIKERQR